MEAFREHVKSFTCVFETFSVYTLSRKSNSGTLLHGNCVRIYNILTYVTTSRKHTKYVKASMCIRNGFTRHRKEKFHLGAYRFYFLHKIFLAQRMLFMFRLLLSFNVRICFFFSYAHLLLFSLLGLNQSL